MGNPTATFDDAAAALQRARIELDAAQDRLGLRQAAEKGWLALADAVDAAAVCKEWAVAGGWDDQKKIVNRLKLPRTTRQIASLRGHLHAACFYGNDDAACEPDFVRDRLADADKVIARLRRRCPSS